MPALLPKHSVINNQNRTYTLAEVNQQEIRLSRGMETGHIAAAMEPHIDLAHTWGKWFLTTSFVVRVLFASISPHESRLCSHEPYDINPPPHVRGHGSRHAKDKNGLTAWGRRALTVVCRGFAPSVEVWIIQAPASSHRQALRNARGNCPNK